MSAVSIRGSATRTPQPLDEVPDSELISGLSPRTNTDSKFGAIPAYGSVDPQQVTKIGVAPLIEGASQSNSRLDRSYHAGPGNLVPQQHLICTFRVWRSGIRRRRSEFDTTLDSAPATERKSIENAGRPTAGSGRRPPSPACVRWQL